MDYEQSPVSPQMPQMDYPDDYDPALNGIGGWLILVIIGRFIAIIMGIKSIVTLSGFLGVAPSFDGLLYIIIVALVLIYIILSGVILYFMFARKIVFRTLFVAQLVADLLFMVILSMVLSNRGYDSTYTGFIQTIIGGAIWIAYLYKSKRVKNTYIYPYQDFSGGPTE